MYASLMMADCTGRNMLRRIFYLHLFRSAAKLLASLPSTFLSSRAVITLSFHVDPGRPFPHLPAGVHSHAFLGCLFSDILTICPYHSAADFFPYNWIVAQSCRLFLIVWFLILSVLVLFTIRLRYFISDACSLLCN
jgi:hypothetical protein